MENKFESNWINCVAFLFYQAKLDTIYFTKILLLEVGLKTSV